MGTKQRDCCRTGVSNPRISPRCAFKLGSNPAPIPDSNIVWPSDNLDYMRTRCGPKLFWSQGCVSEDINYLVALYLVRFGAKLSGKVHLLEQDWAPPVVEIEIIRDYLPQFFSSASLGQSTTLSHSGFILLMHLFSPQL